MTTTKALLVTTFCLENYGSPDKPHWKRKGGSTKWVANVKGEEKFLNACNLGGVIEAAAPDLETRNSSMFIEMVQQVDLIDVPEAERRAAINRKDPMIDSALFFQHIERAARVETYGLSAS